MDDQPFRYHSSHWGAFRARQIGGTLEVAPLPSDPDPSPIIHNIVGAQDHPARLTRPLVRRGWLEGGPGPDDRRGSDDYIEMDWDEALDLAAAELERLGARPDLPETGPLPGAHVFGGSYGWSSAGRFHHAQSQVHRFLNSTFGGYVASRNTYSSAAGEVVMEMVYGNATRMARDADHWGDIEKHSDMVLAFGGLPLRPMQVAPGGHSFHTARGHMERAAERGCTFVSISPLADDLTSLPGAIHLSPRPTTDVAMMLGMAWVLETEGLVNRDYLDRFTTGYDQFLPYLLGQVDGTPKSPEWAAEITGLGADTIRDLARRAAGGQTHVTITYSLQRAENGEQPIWMALVLAAMLGQWEKPGAGFTYSLGSMGSSGKAPLALPLPTFPQGRNRVPDFIPVARISELLLHPGKSYTYKGETREYADIRLVYWAGGNPFHHHQDLQLLTRAFARPDTIIVHDSVGTATANHADIVFPATLTAEREDIGAASADPLLIPMQRLTDPAGEARDDYDIFAELARRLNCEESFTEGLTSHGWLERLYQRTREALEKDGRDAPDLDSFLAGPPIELPVGTAAARMQRYHADPQANALPTPSGRIEIWSDAIAAAGLPGHPAWLAPREWLGSDLAERFPFQLVANQPVGKLHSQLDFGATSMAGKQDGRDIARMNPADAERLGLATGDIILMRNDRGGLLAALAVSDAVMPGVVQLSTGAWYAPRLLTPEGEREPMVICVNGNPNVLTSDAGASALSQGCTGQLSLVAIQKWTGPVPSAVPHAQIMRRG